jgi:predicted lipoprotein with Yx(FWY)xxD motif
VITELRLRRIGGLSALLTGMLATAAFAAEPARMEMTADGPVLVTPAGMTLYVNSAEDTKGEKFTWKCNSAPPVQLADVVAGLGPKPTIGARYQKSCTQKFPPYLADARATASGDYSLVTRPDGTKQWAYRGFPLYTSVRDLEPGDRNGVVVGRLYGAEGRFGQFALALANYPLPAGIKFMRREEGLVLGIEGDDRPLYTPVGKAGTNADARFRTVPAPAMAKGDGDWAVVEPAPGDRQYTYRGKPLYAAPVGMAEFEVAATGAWQTVVVEPDGGRPAEVDKHLSLLGDVYSDKAGRTLYTYSCTAGGVLAIGDRYVECDAAGDPAGYMVATCGSSADCASRWRPYVAARNARPKGDWSIMEVTYPMFTDPRGTLYPVDAPRVKVWAYRGRPVFTYYQDRKPGDITGDAAQGLWGAGFFALRTAGPGFQ